MPDFEPLYEPLGRGRIFSRERRVRFGDVTPTGRLRFDALARYLQDVSNDDTRDARLVDDLAWVVRWTVIDVRRFPVALEPVRLTTFCGGIGSRWAERRISLVGEQGGAVEASTLWVHLDPVSGRPTPLPAQFIELYGEAGGDRTARTKLGLVVELRPAPDRSDPFPLRATDFDVVGHMNNAVYWTALEEVMADDPRISAPLRAEIEFRTAIEPGAVVTIDRLAGPRGVEVVLRGPGVVHAALRATSIT